MLVKYPRTPHLPWSPGATKDDRVIGDVTCCLIGPVVITEKMDGENTTMYRKSIHARSIDSYSGHPSRSWINHIHGNTAYMIDGEERVCGENLYAQHSIHYDNLESYFLAFGIWKHDRCLSWPDTLGRLDYLGLKHVPVLYEGMIDESTLRRFHLDKGIEGNPKIEGFVVRPVRSFTMAEFGSVVAKWVRAGHVQTDEHWMSKPVIPNGLRGE